MSNLKEIDFDSLDMPEIPEAVTLSIENINFEVLPDYTIEKKNGISMHCFEPHKHLFFELIIVMCGSLSIQVDTERFSLISGEYVVIPPTSEHCLISVSDNIQRFRLRFMHTGEIDTSLLSKAPYIKAAFTNSKRELIFALANDLYEIEAPQKSITAEMHIKYELSVILNHAIENYYHIPMCSTASDSGQASLRARIESYMYLNYNRPITLELLAENMSYSRTQMRRIIEECFGMSFTEKLREIRLNAAKKRLIDGKLPIEEIAEVCGYETRQGFESMFLKYVGKTPNQYRRRHNR